MDFKCPDGKKVKPVKAGDLNLYLCNVDWPIFNSKPGSVDLDLNEQIASRKNPGAPFTTLWFRCGAYDGLQQQVAWKLDVELGYDAPDGTSSKGRRQVGLIQTVESLQWDAIYSNGWQKKTMSVKARDAGPGATAPWYGPKGTFGEAVVVEDAPTNHPALSDDPMAQLFISLPEAPCQQIEGVKANGKFHLWLIAWDPDEPLDMAHLVFLWHASIEVKKSWDLPFGKDPTLTPNWKVSGTQTKLDIGLGRGTKTPILEKPVSQDQLQWTVSKTGVPCPAPSGKK